MLFVKCRVLALAANWTGEGWIDFLVKVKEMQGYDVYRGPPTLYRIIFNGIESGALITKNVWSQNDCKDKVPHREFHSGILKAGATKYLPWWLNISQ